MHIGFLRGNEFDDTIFKMTAARKVPQFHLYFDNFFTNLDLVVYLKNLKLKSTETIKDNRVTEKNVNDKKSSRGTYVIKHKENSEINYITIIHSKKQTWVVFIRLIQAAIVNFVVIFNAAGDSKNKVRTGEYVISIAKSYIHKGQQKRKEKRLAKVKRNAVPFVQ